MRLLVCRGCRRGAYDILIMRPSGRAKGAHFNNCDTRDAKSPADRRWVRWSSPRQPRAVDRSEVTVVVTCDATIRAIESAGRDKTPLDMVS